MACLDDVRRRGFAGVNVTFPYKETVVVHVVDLENHRARVANEDEIRDGKFYKDHAEYPADRAAA